MPNYPKQKRLPWQPPRKSFGRRSQFNNQKFYESVAWRRLRKLFISSFPLCKHCKQKGVIKAAKVVDHIQPIRLGGAELDWENLQSLCESCHNRKSAKESHKI